jgi:hypothetical protein
MGERGLQLLPIDVYFMLLVPSICASLYISSHLAQVLKQAHCTFLETERTNKSQQDRCYVPRTEKIALVFQEV